MNPGASGPLPAPQKYSPLQFHWWALHWGRAVVTLFLAGIFVAAYLLAALLRFDLELSPAFFQACRLLPVVVAAQLGVFLLHGAHRGWMRYAGLQDLWLILRASALAALMVGATVFALRVDGVARSIILLDLILAFLGVAAARLAARMLREIIFPRLRTATRATPSGPRLLIIGAGDTGDAFLREIHRNQTIQYNVVGFLDDNVKKVGAVIHGVPVLGTVTELRFFVEQERVEEVIIATPTASGAEIRRIVDLCQRSGVRFRRLPALEDLVQGRVTVSELREVSIGDLLRRDPVQLDHAGIADYLANRIVAVTGAGGSIGSEICRQVARFQPRQLLLIERFEGALFFLERELRQAFPDLTVVPLIADVTDAERMQAIFAEYRPYAVFHAAAHKHVPLMEQNPGEAVKNNIGGTRNVADLSARYGVHTFVLISTDKAVNPTSVMGATKRVCELYLQTLARTSKTRFVAVRFGNVLGSFGSVVPLFQEQIRKGGPVLVTHPDMRRYFMTIPEASQLVLQAAALGQGSEVFVLDMGEPVKIVDLARDLIRLSGLSEDDIEIKFTGLRPGEKLFEELALSSENATKTRHPKIWTGQVGHIEPALLKSLLDNLFACADGRSAAIVSTLRRIVPEFVPPETSAAAGAEHAQQRPDEGMVSVRATRLSIA